MTGHRRALIATTAAALLVALAACAPEPSPSAAPSAGTTASASATPAESAASPSPSASSTATAAVAMPTDCRAILSADVLAQLGGVPLNDPAWGPSGAQADSLTCIWADPGADTTGLTTKIIRMSRGPVLDMLNKLVDEQAFVCYQPDAGTRCDKQWPNQTYPVTDGRTLYWRDGLLIDTTYSNLAPNGYTASIVAHIWP